jgi:hypothetical protein
LLPVGGVKLMNVLLLLHCNRNVADWERGLNLMLTLLEKII